MSTQETKKKSLEVGFPTFEVIQKHRTSREERELEDCGHSVYKKWRGACVKDRCTRKHLQFEPLEKKEENEQNHHGFLLIAFSCVMQIQHWNTRMNQVRRYFKKRRFTHALRWL